MQRISFLDMALTFAPACSTFAAQLIVAAAPQHQACEGQHRTRMAARSRLLQIQSIDAARRCTRVASTTYRPSWGQTNQCANFSVRHGSHMEASYERPQRHAQLTSSKHHSPWPTASHKKKHAKKKHEKNNVSNSTS